MDDEICPKLEFKPHLWLGTAEYQKVFCLYDHMSHFERFQEELPSNDKFYSSLTHKKISEKEYEHVLLRFAINLKWKRLKIIMTCT